MKYYKKKKKLFLHIFQYGWHDDKKNSERHFRVPKKINFFNFVAFNKFIKNYGNMLTNPMSFRNLLFFDIRMHNP